MPLLADVVQAHQTRAAVLIEDAWQVAVAAHRHDRDALGTQVPATATRERLDRAAIALAFDQDHAAQLHARPGDLLQVAPFSANQPTQRSCSVVSIAAGR